MPITTTWATPTGGSRALPNPAPSIWQTKYAGVNGSRLRCLLSHRNRSPPHVSVMRQTSGHNVLEANSTKSCTSPVDRPRAARKAHCRRNQVHIHTSRRRSSDRRNVLGNHSDYRVQEHKRWRTHHCSEKTWIQTLGAKT